MARKKSNQEQNEILKKFFWKKQFYEQNILFLYAPKSILNIRYKKCNNINKFSRQNSENFNSLCKFLHLKIVQCTAITYWNIGKRKDEK